MNRVLNVFALWFLVGSLASASVQTKAFILSKEQTQSFRSWFLVILRQQLSIGPNPRWQHRDCAGLVRFAVNEALRPHTTAWRKANGMLGRALPPDVELNSTQQSSINQWNQIGGTKGSFVKAAALVQENARFVSKDLSEAQPGDLLYFDQRMDQHLMVWTGRDIVYHTGKVTEKDNGLRQVTFSELNQWKDTRWQPTTDNPNFIGFFRLAFL